MNQRFLTAMLEMGIPLEKAELALSETGSVGIEVRPSQLCERPHKHETQGFFVALKHMHASSLLHQCELVVPPGLTCHTHSPLQTSPLNGAGVSRAHQLGMYAQIWAALP